MGKGLRLDFMNHESVTTNTFRGWSCAMFRSVVVMLFENDKM